MYYKKNSKKNSTRIKRHIKTISILKKNVKNSPKTTSKVRKISTETALKIARLSNKVKYEKMQNWIPAGSGSFRESKEDGRYRERCNTVKYELQCKNDPAQKKLIYYHCNKLDCWTCFISACSIKARRLNERLTEFRKLCYINGIKMGRMMHVSLFINEKKEHFSTAEQYRLYKRRILYPALEKLGFVGGIVFLHLWSNVCTRCNQKYYYCHCSELQAIEKKINVHFHVIGFGYLQNATEFHAENPNFVYIHHLPNRKDGYFTIFYALSKIALWRKQSGKLLPAYNLFGYVHPKRFYSTQKIQQKAHDTCPACREARVISKVQETEITTQLHYTYHVSKKRFVIKDVKNLKTRIQQLEHQFQEQITKPPKTTNETKKNQKKITTF